VAETLIVQSKVRDMIKAHDCATSEEAIQAISAEVERLVQKAVERTKANGRKTVKGSDI
jgi:histone H3/H4